MHGVPSMESHESEHEQAGRDLDELYVQGSRTLLGLGTGPPESPVPASSPPSRAPREDTLNYFISNLRARSTLRFPLGS